VMHQGREVDLVDERGAAEEEDGFHYAATPINRIALNIVKQIYRSASGP
jgi:hypothetical protein